jgi:Mycobacterial 4 TMS phage holin, superfamily IV
MRRILARAVVLLGSFAIGLLLAVWVVPGVSMSASAFIIAVLVFSAAQVVLTLVILKLPHGYASLLLGGSGLAVTFLALGLAAASTHGLTIDGGPAWLATALIVWLVTTIGAISLPDVLAGEPVGST